MKNTNFGRVNLGNLAIEDINKLKRDLKIEVFNEFKKINKELYYGKELDNKHSMNLKGCYKVYFDEKRYRIVYRILKDKKGYFADVIAVGERNNLEVYKETFRRLFIEKYSKEFPSSKEFSFDQAMIINKANLVSNKLLSINEIDEKYKFFKNKIQDLKDEINNLNKDLNRLDYAGAALLKYETLQKQNSGGFNPIKRLFSKNNQNYNIDFELEMNKQKGIMLKNGVKDRADYEKQLKENEPKIIRKISLKYEIEKVNKIFDIFKKAKNVINDVLARESYRVYDMKQSKKNRAKTKIKNNDEQNER